MPSPDSVDNFILVEELGVLGGCLCVLVPGYGVCDYVWVMKEYGMRDSWIKFTINCNNFCKPLCLSTTGEVLLEVSQRKLVLFNPQERKSKELVVRGSPYLFEAGTYMESLVSPNFSNINDHEGSRFCGMRQWCLEQNNFSFRNQPFSRSTMACGEERENERH
ncbi:hypothetical protein CsSME_00045082 [Camellia sinensis var. sinensis]